VKTEIRGEKERGKATPARLLSGMLWKGVLSGVL
jgi:hypothetical protein